ncbi:hypothetical protein LARI1_G003840 [Lachnellula arida]|uniref:N-acetyltransferase domain-containing protein n=1 Tax=Lachnellula arida TaxID=1316785 RepID=A0A8T9BAX4_9HELO|nr:hypothetical protein LARI1_G003840 [Lachnellula arida]
MSDIQLNPDRLVPERLSPLRLKHIFEINTRLSTPLSLTMPLKLKEIDLEDFNTMTDHANIYPPEDDLVGPPTPICWLVTTPSEAQNRLDFHMTKQKERYLGDTSARYLKIIDEETGEIISMARWHWYPDGYSYTEGIHWETHNAVEGCPWPKGMNVELHNWILTRRDAAREHWQEKGQPCWILMHLVTRASQRGRGAASMLINWGVERARKDAVPAYLEAGVLAVPLYAKHGFRQVGDLLRFDLRGHGVDLDFVMAKMGFFPEVLAEVQAGKKIK